MLFVESMLRHADASAVQKIASMNRFLRKSIYAMISEHFLRACGFQISSLGSDLYGVRWRFLSSARTHSGVVVGVSSKRAFKCLPLWWNAFRDRTSGVYFIFSGIAREVEVKSVYFHTFCKELASRRECTVFAGPVCLAWNTTHGDAVSVLQSLEHLSVKEVHLCGDRRIKRDTARPLNALDRIDKSNLPATIESLIVTSSAFVTVRTSAWTLCNAMRGEMLSDVALVGIGLDGNVWSKVLREIRIPSLRRFTLDDNAGYTAVAAFLSAHPSLESVDFDTTSHRAKLRNVHFMPTRLVNISGPAAFVKEFVKKALNDRPARLRTIGLYPESDAYQYKLGDYAEKLKTSRNLEVTDVRAVLRTVREWGADIARGLTLSLTFPIDHQGAYKSFLHGVDTGDEETLAADLLALNLRTESRNRGSSGSHLVSGFQDGMLVILIARTLCRLGLCPGWPAFRNSILLRWKGKTAKRRGVHSPTRYSPVVAISPCSSRKECP